MSDIVTTPAAKHACAIGFEDRELPSDHRLRAQGFTHYVAPVHEHDPVGTVRACRTCRKTWVAHRPLENVLANSWRPEGRLARWWRERHPTGGVL